MLLPLCSHHRHHVGPYLISGDEAIAVFVHLSESFFVKSHPFAFADTAVMIGIHVLEHPIDHLLHSGVPVRRRSFSRRGRRLSLRKKKTAVNHKYDTNQDKNCFPSSHLTFPSSRRLNEAHNSAEFAITCKNQFLNAFPAPKISRNRDAKLPPPSHGAFHPFAKDHDDLDPPRFGEFLAKGSSPIRAVVRLASNPSRRVHFTLRPMPEAEAKV